MKSRADTWPDSRQASELGEMEASEGHQLMNISDLGKGRCSKRVIKEKQIERALKNSFSFIKKRHDFMFLYIKYPLILNFNVDDGLVSGKKRNHSPNFYLP